MECFISFTAAVSKKKYYFYLSSVSVTNKYLSWIWRIWFSDLNPSSLAFFSLLAFSWEDDMAVGLVTQEFLGMFLSHVFFWKQLISLQMSCLASSHNSVLFTAILIKGILLRQMLMYKPHLYSLVKLCYITWELLGLPPPSFHNGRDDRVRKKIYENNRMGTFPFSNYSTSVFLCLPRYYAILLFLKDSRL